MTAGMRTVSRLRAQKVTDDKADAGHKDSKMSRMENLGCGEAFDGILTNITAIKECLSMLKCQLVNKTLT